MGVKLENLPLHVQKQVLKQLAAQAKPPEQPKEPKRNKYGAVRTFCDGMWFDSGGEADRWLELKRLRALGYIRELERQVPYALKVGDVRLGEYRADFVYEKFDADKAEWVKVVDDFKGKRTELYDWKAKHMKAQYGITIYETTKPKKGTRHATR